MTDRTVKKLRSFFYGGLVDVATAASLLSRFPLKSSWIATDRMAASAWAFPIIGAIIGALAGVVGILLSEIGMSGNSVAIAALATMILASGAMHEDGLADCADGLGGGTGKDRILEIMKDSRIGAYGVIALCLFLGAQWSALAEIAHANLFASLVITGSASRAPMTVVMALVPNARSGGLSQYVGTPATSHAAVAVLVSALICIGLAGTQTGLLAFLIAAIAPIPLLLVAHRKIGGQTGDVLGATQQFAALGILLTLSTT